MDIRGAQGIALSVDELDRTYFDEFKAAVNRYINGLENGTENIQNLEDSLNDSPELL
ncbi:MAG: hypothetical protein WB975_09465 [Nitrososphaeraceae archaeon]